MAIAFFVGWSMSNKKNKPIPSEGSELIRELGGCEAFLARKFPGTEKVSMPVSSAFLLDGSVSHEVLLEAVERSLERHPMLRAYTMKDPESGKQYWCYCTMSIKEMAKAVLKTTEIPSKTFDSVWRNELEASMNDISFHCRGPLWWMKNIGTDCKGKTCWLMCLNHGQDALMPHADTWRLCSWGLSTMFKSTLKPINPIPAMIVQNYKEDPVKYAHYENHEKRKGHLEYLSLTKEETEALRAVCHAQGVTISSALSAAMLSLTSFLLQNGINKDGEKEELQTQNLKFFMPVCTRHMAPNDKPISDKLPSTGQITPIVDSSSAVKRELTGGAVACAAGFMDFVVTVPVSTAAHAREIAAKGEAIKSEDPEFWSLAKDCRARAKAGVDAGFTEHLLVFEFLIRTIALLDIIAAEGKDPKVMGRAAAGLSNVGAVEFSKPHGKGPSLTVREAYFATGLRYSGALLFNFAMTVEGCQCMTLIFPTVLTTPEESLLFRDGLLAILRDIIKK